jgi:ribonuclease HII
VSLKPPKALPKSEIERLKKLTELEGAARAKGYKSIAGVDEAGRGPLAGPVVAAACMIQEGLYFPGINDSKLLLPKRRRALFEELIAHEGVHYAVGVVENRQIDEINILQATLEAMRIAVKKMAVALDCLLVDGNHLFLESIYSEAIVKGDSRSQMIAAASIIAKERRDQIMMEYHHHYPEYGFDEHKGYATEKHREALAKYGPCPIHRRSFSSVLQEEEQLTLFE